MTSAVSRSQDTFLFSSLSSFSMFLCAPSVVVKRLIIPHQSTTTLTMKIVQSEQPAVRANSNNTQHIMTKQSYQQTGSPSLQEPTTVQLASTSSSDDVRGSVMPMTCKTSTKGTITTTNLKLSNPSTISTHQIAAGASDESSALLLLRTGRWTLDEKILFLYALRKFGKGRWKKMKVYLPHRSLVQIKSHAQKVLKRIESGENVFRRLEENAIRSDALIAKIHADLGIPFTTTTDSSSGAYYYNSKNNGTVQVVLEGNSAGPYSHALREGGATAVVVDKRKKKKTKMLKNREESKTMTTNVLNVQFQEKYSEVSKQLSYLQDPSAPTWLCDETKHHVSTPKRSLSLDSSSSTEPQEQQPPVRKQQRLLLNQRADEEQQQQHVDDYSYIVAASALCELSRPAAPTTLGSSSDNDSSSSSSNEKLAQTATTPSVHVSPMIPVNTVTPSS